MGFIPPKTLIAVSVIFGLLSSGNLFAQPDSLWSHTYGGSSVDEGYALIQTADGGFAMAGKTESYGNGWYDFLLVRTDAQGDSLWYKTYGGGSDDVCTAILQSADGGFALAGYTDSFGAGLSDFWLVLTDENGNALAGYTYGGNDEERCSAMIQLEDGGYVLAGTTSSFGAGKTDFWLVRTDENGDSLWTRTYGTPDAEECTSLIQTKNGGFALGGTRGVRGMGSQTYVLVQTDADGNSLSSSSFGGQCDDDLHSIAQTADGGYLLAGFTCSFAPHDFWLVRTDADGDSLWQRNYGGWDWEECMSIIHTADGGFALAGYAISFGAGDRDFWVLRINANGDSLWSRSFGGAGADDARVIIQTADDGFALGGITKSIGAGSSDFWLVKTGPDPVSVSPDEQSFLPNSVTLSAPYPNPFNARTTIGYSLPVAGSVTLAVYDISGRLVERLFNGQCPAGNHSVVWDASSVAAGVYLIKLQNGDEVKTNKVAVVK